MFNRERSPVSTRLRSPYQIQLETRWMKHSLIFRNTPKFVYRCLALFPTQCHHFKFNFASNGTPNESNMVPKAVKKYSRGDPAAAPGPPWGPKGAPAKTNWKKRCIWTPPGHPRGTQNPYILQQHSFFHRFLGAPGRNTRFCRQIREKESILEGGNVVIHCVESTK